MSLKGNLTTVYINSILQLLGVDEKSGILSVKNPNIEVKVFFLHGKIIYATGSKKEYRLGHRLQRKELISRDQLQAGLELSHKTNKSLAKILVEKGCIALEEMKQEIRNKVQEIIYDLFIWQNGDFEYKDARLDLERMVAVSLDVVTILLQASRRVDEMSILRKHIPNENLIFRTSNPVQAQGEIKLNADEWQVLRLVDGMRSVRQIIERGGFDEFAAYKCLYSLLSSGLIENGQGQNAEERSKIEQDYSVAITIFSDILQTIGRSLEAEIGNQMFTIFTECRPVLNAPLSELFKDYFPNNPTATTIHVISQALQPIDDFEDGRNFLIKGFNTFIENILNRIQAILGKNFVQNLVQELDKLLVYVETHQEHSPERSLVIREVQKALADIAEKIVEPDKNMPKPGGLISKLKRA
jgi:hypothetical protein